MAAHRDTKKPTPKPTPATPADPATPSHPNDLSNRTRYTIIATILTLAILLALIAILRTHNQPAEAENPQNPQAARETLLNTIAPTKGVGQSLITPAGEAWWRMITSQSVDLDLNTTDTPDNSAWYFYTSSRAYSAPDHNLTDYTAIHIGFRSIHDATRWMSLNATGQNLGLRRYLLRDSVVTVTPSWVEIDDEPFRDTKTIRTALHATPTAGAWNVNWTEIIDQTAESTDHEAAYKDMFQAIGFPSHDNPDTPDDDVTWSATSTTPAGPWTGHLNNWDESTVNVNNLTHAATSTAELDCKDTSNNTQMCVESDMGLASLATAGTFRDNYGSGFGIYDYQWFKKPLAKNQIVEFVLTGDWEGNAATINTISRTSLGARRFVIDTDHTLTLTLSSDKGYTNPLTDDPDRIDPTANIDPDEIRDAQPSAMPTPKNIAPTLTPSAAPTNLKPPKAFATVAPNIDPNTGVAPCPDDNLGCADPDNVPVVPGDTPEGTGQVLGGTPPPNLPDWYKKQLGL